MALVVKKPPANAGAIRDAGSTSESGRSPGGGHGSPLQHSCLENPHGQRSLEGFSPQGHRVRHDWARIHRDLKPWSVGVDIQWHCFKNTQEALFVCLRSCSELWSPLSLGVVYWGVTYICENVLIKCTVRWILANAYSHVITMIATNRENTFLTSQIPSCPLQQILFPLPRPWSHWPDLCPLVYFL